MRILITVVFLLNTSLAEFIEPCVSPAVWEGREFSIVGNSNEMGFSKLSVDGINNRLRRTGKKHDDLYKLDQNKMYRFDVATGECEEILSIVPPWPDHRPYSIPKRATFIEEGQLGAASQNQYVYITKWTGQMNGYNISGVWTQDGCIPVFYNTYNLQTKEFITRSFFDITIGISDAKVFDKPKSCQWRGK